MGALKEAAAWLRDAAIFLQPFAVLGCVIAAALFFRAGQRVLLDLSDAIEPIAGRILEKLEHAAENIVEGTQAAEDAAKEAAGLAKQGPFGWLRRR